MLSQFLNLHELDALRRMQGALSSLSFSDLAASPSRIGGHRHRAHGIALGHDRW